MLYIIIVTHYSARSLAALAEYCAEFLIHAVDVEGRCMGVNEDLVRILGEYATSAPTQHCPRSPIPVTYAGGVRSLDDLAIVQSLGQNAVSCFPFTVLILTAFYLVQLP